MVTSDGSAVAPQPPPGGQPVEPVPVQGSDGSASFLTAVLASLTDALVACNAAGELTVFNPAAQRLHGLPAVPIPAEQWSHYYDLFEADGTTPLPHERVPLLRALRGEHVRDVEMVVAPAGRPPRTLLASGQQIVGADDVVIGAVVAMHDVTQQRAAEQLRAEQALLEQRRAASDARGRAFETSLRRLQQLNEAALEVNRQQTVQAVLQAITEQAARVIGADQAVASLTRGDDWSQAITSVVLGQQYQQWAQYDRMPDGSGIYALVCETNAAVRLTQAELEAHPRWHGFGEHAPEHPPMRGWLAAPLVRRDGTNLGLVQLSDKQGAAEDGRPTEFDEQDQALLVQLAQLASLALEKAVEFEREHLVAVELQRSLLPHTLPALPGLLCHVEYVPGLGEPDLNVGGDFYDAFALGDDVVALALGDVVGHGLRSASLMGQIRSALRGLAMEQRDPALVVSALDRLVATLGDDAMATLAYATLHVPTGALRLVSAGHPPPLMRTTDGVVQLDAEPGLPLGALPGGGYTALETTVPPGATLLLYSDGLVESRVRPVGQGITELEAAMTGTHRDLPALCQHLLATLTGGLNDDDVALLAIHRSLI